jgi:hypothetical protein
MKLIYVVFFFVSSLISFCYASWEDITSVIETKKNKFFTKSTEPPSMYSMEMSIKKSVSLRLNFSANDSVTVLLLKDTVIIKQIRIKSGTGELKYQFEPGFYMLKSISPVSVQLFRWKKVKVENVMPAGGGYPQIMTHKNKQYEYYMVSKSSTNPSFKISGPAIINIYSRLLLPDEMYKSPFELTVRENNKNVFSKRDTLERSQYVSLQNDKSNVLTNAFVAKMQVPRGVHSYSISFNNCDGLVKVNKESIFSTMNLAWIKKNYGTFKITSRDIASGYNGSERFKN